MSILDDVMKRVMVLMMMSDQDLDTVESDQIIEIYDLLCEGEITTEDVQAEVEAVRADTHELIPYLQSVAPDLSDEERCAVVEAAVMVAAADGIFADEEKMLLADLARELHVPQDKVNGYIDQMFGFPE